MKKDFCGWMIQTYTSFLCACESFPGQFLANISFRIWFCFSGFSMCSSMISTGPICSQVLLVELNSYCKIILNWNLWVSNCLIYNHDQNVKNFLFNAILNLSYNNNLNNLKSWDCSRSTFKKIIWPFSPKGLVVCYSNSWRDKLIRIIVEIFLFFRCPLFKWCTFVELQYGNFTILSFDFIPNFKVALFGSQP